jgi:hypothetical protein
MFLEVQATQNSGKETHMVEEQYETAEAEDETDVPAALDSQTDDGKGGAVVPRTDFVGYEVGDNVTAYEESEGD